MNPVGKDDKFRKLVHSLPRDLLIGLDILYYLERLRLLADGIGRMAGAAKVNIRDGRGAISLHITMAESAI